MKTKYFRFLYCSMKSCLVHFGELTDTLTGERFTFLYVNSAGKSGEIRSAKGAPFRYPNRIDLLVLGAADERTEAVLQDVTEKAEIGMLVLPKSSRDWDADLTAAEKLVELSAEGSAAQTKGEGQSCVMLTKNGWRFFMKSYTAGNVAMAHSLDGNPELFGNLPGYETGTDDKWENPYEDCVMNVKVFNGEQRCCMEQSPDGYACALGCALKKDSDVCKYQRSRAGAVYLTGTLLCGRNMTEEAFDRMERELGLWFGEMRFFAPSEAMGKAVRGAEEYKRYYIETKENAKERDVKRICESGLYAVPALLGDGEGICCSGLLKYAE